MITMKRTKLTKALSALALALVYAFATVLTGCSSEFKIEVEMIPVKLAKHGNWSMLKPDGTIAYEDEFEETPTFVINGIFSVKDSNGFTVYKAADKPLAIKDMEGLKDVGVMSDGLIPAVAPNSRIALYDEEGHKKFELMPHKGNEIVNCSAGYTEGMLMVEDETGKVGYVDTEGKMVIEPQYNYGSDFREGYAIVYTKEEGDDSEGPSAYKKAVIDKKGVKVMSIKQDYDVIGKQVKDGYVPVRDANDRILFLDLKDNHVKCPEKVESVTYWNKDFYIFKGEDCYGVMNYEGETLIRAKYDELSWDEDNEIFVARQSDDYLILDKKGEKVCHLDYLQAQLVPGFGIIAFQKRTIELIDKEGKQIGKEEFYDMISELSGGRVESDYFNAEGIIHKLVEKLNDKGYGKVKLGTGPSDYLDTPVFAYNATVIDMTERGFRYSVEVEIFSNEYFAKWQDGEWQWNAECKIQMVAAKLNTDGDWKPKHDDAVVKAVGKKGFKQLACNEKDGIFMAVLQKGDTYVIYRSDNKCLFILNGSEPNIKADIDNMVTQLNATTDEAKAGNTGYTANDSVAVDTVA